MSIHTEIREKIKEAMRSKDTLKLNVLRGLLTAFTNELVSKKHKPDEELSDEDAMNVIQRSVKQRKDSIEQFEKGGRPDLAHDETAELRVLETFLPEQMSKDEVLAFVKAKQAETGSTDPAKKGQFMGLVMKDLKGKADSVYVKDAIDSLFS
ncbi:MAG: GatB/YqeY domain-containing protein [Patescibacteria group bacterium]